MLVLSVSGPEKLAAAAMELRWAKGALPQIRSLLSDSTVTMSWPWEGADCERPNDLVQASALICDSALYSDPILQVVVGLFTLSGSALRFENDESIYGKTICVPLDQDVSALNGEGRNWLTEKRVSAMRQPTLLDCVSAVQKLEADAFVGKGAEPQLGGERIGGVAVQILQASMLEGDAGNQDRFAHAAVPGQVVFPVQPPTLVKGPLAVVGLFCPPDGGGPIAWWRSQT